VSTAQTTTGVRAILSNPLVYEAWGRFVGAEGWRRKLIADHVRPQRGERVLDLGCGPAELLPHLGEVGYTGVDISEPYILRARETMGDRGEFRVGSATAIDADLEGFDLVVALGVLHHIDDGGVRDMFAGAARALKPSGRMVTVDPVLVPAQHRVARAIIVRDRGQHVRSADGYVSLAQRAFGSVTSTVRTDLLRIPYTHCVLECRAPSRLGRT
jgi:SAM-dependent methyltransferase